MVRLALAAGQGSELAGSRASVAVDPRTVEEAFRRLGDTVLIYLHVNGAVLEFVGRGRVSGVILGERDRPVVVLDPYQALSVPVAGTDELNVPGARRLIELEDGRFDEIVEQAEQSGTLSAAEAVAEMGSSPTEATYIAIRDQVLRVWRNRCAFTGASEKDGAGLNIVAIRPRDQGGPLHVGNYLPMVSDLERGWRLGHFSVGEDFRILGDLYRLPPEDQDRMVALFKMLLPGRTIDYPSTELLAWHRLNVFGRS